MPDRWGLFPSTEAFSQPCSQRQNTFPCLPDLIFPQSPSSWLARNSAKTTPVSGNCRPGLYNFCPGFLGPLALAHRPKSWEESYIQQFSALQILLLCVENLPSNEFFFFNSLLITIKYMLMFDFKKSKTKNNLFQMIKFVPIKKWVIWFFLSFKFMS